MFLSAHEQTMQALGVATTHNPYESYKLIHTDYILCMSHTDYMIYNYFFLNFFQKYIFFSVMYFFNLLKNIRIK